jgi:hypothetical protein
LFGNVGRFSGEANLFLASFPQPTGGSPQGVGENRYGDSAKSYDVIMVGAVPYTKRANRKTASCIEARHNRRNNFRRLLPRLPICTRPFAIALGSIIQREKNIPAKPASLGLKGDPLTSLDCRSENVIVEAICYTGTGTPHRERFRSTQIIFKIGGPL